VFETSGNSEALLSDASLMVGLGQLDEAEETLVLVLRRADAAQDDDLASRAYEGLGMIATLRGRETRARDLFVRAVERGGEPEPAERPALYLELSRVLSSVGEPQQAVDLLNWGLEHLDASADGILIARFSTSLSFALADLGEYGRASVVLSELLRDRADELDHSTRSNVNYALSRLSHNTGRTDQALVYAQRALEAAVASGDASIIFRCYMLAAATQLDAGNTEAAAEHLRSARGTLGESGASDVDMGFLLIDEARCALQQNDQPAALERATEAVELLGDMSMPGLFGLAQLTLARVYEEMGEPDRADRAYRASIEGLKRQNGWNTDLAKAYRRYGKFLRAQGRDALALEMLENASDLVPEGAGPS
jgi:tetratricopeptide (TPR) repeat protein